MSHTERPTAQVFDFAQQKALRQPIPPEVEEWWKATQKAEKENDDLFRYIENFVS